MSEVKSAMAIQCLPLVEGGKETTYALVDAAIEAIDASGLPYTVGPFETVVEGPLEELIEVAKRAHRAVLDRGAGKVFTYIKLASGEELGSSEEKIRKYRERGH